MKKKKSSQPGSTKVPPPRILAPPLFPPGFNFLPPPPAPPQIEYEEYESIMCENSAVLELVDEVTDTPRSPDVVPGTFNFAISSSDASDDDLDYELDLDEAKHEQQQRTRELSRLFKQQKKNKSEYEASKKAVERKRVSA
jgi:hypothetical protein